LIVTGRTMRRREDRARAYRRAAADEPGPEARDGAADHRAEDREHRSLDGAPEPPGFEAELTRETRRARRSARPYPPFLLDCDDFKRINETLGHAVGDIVLQQIAHRLRDSLRPTDHLARIGGDEFLVLLPDTRTAEAVQAAERLRLAVSDNPLRSPTAPCD
jgi:diguanylate cyclase (GGDEF)-like protein